MQLLDGFDLNEQAIIDEQVYSERGFEAETVDDDVHWVLARDAVPQARQLTCHHRFVDGFQEPWPDLAMQPYGRIEDVASNLVYVPHAASLRLCVSARI